MTIKRLAVAAAMTVILGASALAEEMICICPASQYVRIEREDGAWYIVSANGRVAKRKSPGGGKTGWLNPGVRIQVMGWRYGSDGRLWARVYGGAYVSADYLKRE